MGDKWPVPVANALPCEATLFVPWAPSCSLQLLPCLVQAPSSVGLDLGRGGLSWGHHRGPGLLLPASTSHDPRGGGQRAGPFPSQG